MRTFVIVLLICAAAGGGFYYTRYLRAEPVPNFRTAEVERGDLLVTISASGTIEPEEVVDVGAQVVGRIKELGPDPRGKTDPKYKDEHVDYNSVVSEGDLLAQIDQSLFEAALNQAQAAVDRAKADLLQMQAKEIQTEAEWKRAQRLREVKLASVLNSAARNSNLPAPTTIKGISDADFILAKANYDVARANVKVAEAAVKQQEAALVTADTNYRYTTIRSPVSGTIIERRVNVGQTVVSSLNAPSLFLIAKDLRRMEIWTAVNEADIGQIKVGMPVNFMVDAYPGEVFHGTVSEIRLNAQLEHHVVVYRVLVSTNNDDHRLLPYLSAHVKFETDRREDVLLVPNGALRYQPRPELVTSPPRKTPDSGPATDAAEVETVTTADDGSQAGDASSPSADGEVAEVEFDEESVRRVWVRRGNSVYPIDVVVGLTDGSRSEIVAGDLEPGMELVLAEDREEVVSEGTNPLAPPRLRGKKKKES